MGGCQNNGPFLGPLHTRCHIILRIQKRTTILTITHVDGISREQPKKTSAPILVRPTGSSVEDPELLGPQPASKLPSSSHMVGTICIPAVRKSASQLFLDCGEGGKVKCGFWTTRYYRVTGSELLDRCICTSPVHLNRCLEVTFVE